MSNNHKKIYVIFSFLLLLCIPAVLYSDNQKFLTIKDYKGKLQNIQNLLYSLKKDNSIEILKKTTEILPANLIVVENRESINVDNRWIINSIEELGETESDFEFNKKLDTLKSKLSLLSKEIKYTSYQYPNNPKTIIAGILSQKEFSPKSIPSFLKKFQDFLEKTFNKIRNYLGKILEKLGDKLKKFIDRFAKYCPLPKSKKTTPDIYGGFMIFIYTFLIVSGIILIITAQKKGLFSYFFKRYKIKKVSAADESAEIDRWQFLKIKSDEAAKAGNLKLAVHYLYLSLLLFLDEKKILIYIPSITNQEYLRRIEKRPDIYPLFNDLTITFDNVWYGKKHFIDTDYFNFVSKYEGITKA